MGSLAGVPQGDVLSPTLFLKIGNDYPNPTINEQTRNFALHYADDFTQVIISKFRLTINQKSKELQKIHVEEEIRKQNSLKRAVRSPYCVKSVNGSHA